jgi:hypothetical protein
MKPMSEPTQPDGMRAGAGDAVARRDASVRGAVDGRRRGCLFCRRSDGSFTSVEHIFPESLGNKELVLPVGVVCDRCNNQALSPLDRALCDFPPVAMMRTLHGVESKAGKRPIFKFDNGSLGSNRPGHIQLDLASRKWHKDGLPAPPGHTSWSFTAQRSDMTEERFAMVHRALTKIAVECAWLDLGEERLLSPEFDRERRIVLDGGHHGYLIIPKQGAPEDASIWMTHLPVRRKTDGQPYLGMVAHFQGFRLVSDTLNPRPQGNVPDLDAIIYPF